MGVAANNRGTKVIRSQIDAEVKGNERRFGYQFERELTRLGNTIEKQAAEIEQLQAELSKAKDAYHRRSAELQVNKDELAESKETIERYRKLWLETQEHIKLVDLKHRKLSAIVRLALPPEQYHEYRKCIEAEYPEFRSKDQ